MARATFFVAVDCIVVRDNHILLGMRRGAFGAGFWGLPGGHLEDREGIEEAALRELREETGLEATSAEFISLFNNKNRPNAEHYLHVGMRVNEFVGEPAVKEPERCERWQWFPLTDLPRNEILWVHLPLIDAYLNNKRLIDDE